MAIAIVWGKGVRYNGGLEWIDSLENQLSNTFGTSEYMFYSFLFSLIIGSSQHSHQVEVHRNQEWCPATFIRYDYKYLKKKAEVSLYNILFAFLTILLGTVETNMHWCSVECFDMYKHRPWQNSNLIIDNSGWKGWRTMIKMWIGGQKKISVHCQYKRGVNITWNRSYVIVCNDLSETIWNDLWFSANTIIITIE
jgi:hypothetical protein